VGCHKNTPSIPPFLADPMLPTLLGSGLIGDTPANSRLYTKGAHNGPAFSTDQAMKVASWIVLYNANKPSAGDMGTSGPMITPFVPTTGTMTNVIDLGALNPQLAGQTIRFNAEMIGSSIRLSQIVVNAAPTMGVQMKSPLWVIWDSNGIPSPDPVDSFGGLDLTVYQTETRTMGPGTLILTGFKPGSKLNVVFNAIQPKSGTAPVLTTGCKSVAMFGPVRTILATQCYNCHAAGTAGLTMSAALSDADMCANVRGEIDTTTPANSRLLQKPNPAVAGHNGANQKLPAATFTNFQTAVNNWINAEK
jgi:hypothetical protein